MGSQKEEFEVNEDHTESSDDSGSLSQSDQSDQSSFQTIKSSSDETPSSESSTDPSSLDPNSEPSTDSTSSATDLSSETPSSFETSPSSTEFSSNDLEHDSADVTVTDSESHFLVNESLFPDQLIFEDSLIADQEIEALPEPIVIEGLIAELETVENELQLTDVTDSILAEQEVTTTDILDSLGDKETIVLDVGPSDEQENIDTNEVSSHGHDQVLQLLLEPVQEQEEPDQLTDDQEVSNTSQIEQGEVIQELPPISEEERSEQEQLGLEIHESSLEMMAPVSEIIGGTYTQEKLEQLERDYQESLEQRATLEADSSSEGQQETDLDQQTAEISHNVVNEIEVDNELDFTHQEGVSDNILTLEQEEPQIFLTRAIESSEVTESDQQTDREESMNEVDTPIHFEQPDYRQESSMDTETTSIMDQEEPSLVTESETPYIFEDLLPETSFPSYFSTQETISTRLFSELCLMEDTLDSRSDDLLDSTTVSETSLDFESNSTSNLFQDLEPEFLSIEEYLSSIESPRFLGQFHTQMQEETTQGLLIDDSQVLPNLESSLELVSEGPTIPEPPPYDFLQDLEEQEEANRNSSSTRSQLLWGLQQARLRQEAANYQFALRNLPLSRRQPNLHSQMDNSLGKSDHSHVVNKDDLLNSTIKKRKGRSDKPLDQDRKDSIQRFPFKLRYPWSDRPRHNVSQQQQTKESNIPSDQPGLYSSLAHHIIQLQRGGTATRLDSAIRTSEDKMKVVDAIVRKEWGQASESMRDLIDKYQIKLDSQIVESIHQLIRQECRIRRIFEPLHERVVISSKMGWKKFQYAGVTEFVFSNVNPTLKTLERINIPNLEFLIEKTSFNDEIFQDYNLWNKEIIKQETIELNIDNFPPIQLHDFKSEYDYPKILEKDSIWPLSPKEKLLTIAKITLVNGDLVKGFRYFQWQRIKNPLSSEVQEKTSYNTFLPGKIKFSIKNLHEFLRTRSSEPIMGSLTVPIRKNLFKDMKPRIEGEKEDPYESDIEDLIHQDGIIEGLLSMLGQYTEGDLLITRTQVSTFGSTKVSINKSLNQEMFGKPESEPIRRYPDSVSLIFRGEEKDIKIGIIIIESKRGRDEFNHSSTIGKAGYGRGQPLRDLPWVAAKIKEKFPDITDENIEISCYTLTAYMEEGKDAFVIEGEELVRQVPASKVLPFAGLNARTNSQVYEQIRGIHENTSEREEN